MVLALRDAGERVVVVDDLSTGFRNAVPPDVAFVSGQAGDRPLVEHVIAEHGIGAIVHFAAKISAPASIIDPLAYYEANVSQTRSLVAAAMAGGVRDFVFSSSAAVYGQPGRNPVPEDEPTNPLSPYGRSKLIGEWLLEDAARAHGLRYAALRYFNVAGADAQGRAGQSTRGATSVIKLAVQTALGLRPYFEVFGVDYPTRDGTCIRDFIQVSDLAEAHLRALDHLRAGGENLVCNCGYGRGHSVLDVIDAVKRAAAADFEVRYAGRRPGDAAEVVASSALIRQVLGWTPHYDDLATIVGQALAWERKLISPHVPSSDDLK